VLVAGNSAFGNGLSLIFGGVSGVDEETTTDYGGKMPLVNSSEGIVPFVGWKVILPCCFWVVKGSVPNLGKDFVNGQT